MSATRNFTTRKSLTCGFGRTNLAISTDASCATGSLMPPSPQNRSLALCICFLFLPCLPAALLGAGKTMSVAELALYKAADREKILIEGAKSEGQLSLYTSNSVVAGVVAHAFERKFSFLKVSAWTAESPLQLKRVLEENRAARYIADVVESSPESMGVLRRENLLQELYSPELV